MALFFWQDNRLDVNVVDFDFHCFYWIGKFSFSRLLSPKWTTIHGDCQPQNQLHHYQLLFRLSLGVNVWSSQFPVERSPLIYRFSLYYSWLVPTNSKKKKKERNEITAIVVYSTCSPWHRLFWSDGSWFGVARERVNNRIRGHTHAPCSLTHTPLLRHTYTHRHTAYRTRERALRGSGRHHYWVAVHDRNP